MSDLTITERTEPFTLDEVFSFIDDTSISEMDACELKSRIVDMVQADKPKCEDCAGCTTWKCDCANIRAKAIDDFLEKICEKYTEEERQRNYKQYCCNIKNELADIAEQLKGGAE